MRGWLGILSVGVMVLFAAAGCATEVAEGGGGSAGAAGIGGSAGTGAAPSASPTFAEVYTTVLAPRSCTSPYCHASFGGGALEDQHATYVGLIGGVAEGEGCGGAKLVVPGDAEHSMLFLKVSMAEPPCGERMPFSTMPLAAAEIELIRAWIDGGAHE